MTSSRRRRDLEQEFRETFARVLHCISSDGLVAFPGWDSPAGPSRVLSFRPARARLRTTSSQLFLYMEHTYVLIEDRAGQPHVRTVSYIYSVFNASERRILGWHYHPEGRGERPVATPHLHVYVDTEAGGQSLPKLHLPTGRVALEDVVTFLVDGMGVLARPEYVRSVHGEPRWKAILRTSRESFLRDRSWA